MRRHFFLTAAMLFMAFVANAQTKFDLELNHILQTQKVGKTVLPFNAADLGQPKLQSAQAAIVANQTVSVIAQLNEGSTLPESSLQDLGITVNFHEGNFAVLDVPLSSLASLENLPEFVSLEQNKVLQLVNNKSHEATHVDVIQDETKAKAEGLSQAYTGKGVVVGVFDTGIDFNHNNFRDPTTKQTRIKKAIVYTGSSSNETPSIYTASDDIDALTTDYTSQSHGTHTSSTIAGSYTGNYVNKNGTVTYSGVQGAAPEADLVLAGTPSLATSFQMTSLSEMDKTATELNEPLVVNLSIGGHDWNDGNSTICKFYDTFTDNGNKPGRIICISSGNEGDSKSSIHGVLNSSNNHTIKTFIPTSASYTSYYLPYIRIYGKDSTPFTVQLDFYNSSFEKTSTYSASTLKSGGYLSYGTYSNHNNRYGVTLYDSGGNFTTTTGVYCSVTISSTADCEFYLYAMTIAGENVDLTDNGKSGYTAGSTDNSINYLCCTNSVLSVGAWTSHNEFYSYNGSYYSYNSSVVGSTGDITAFSSYTSADDNGVQRPDFVSPGVSVVSGYNSYDTSMWKNSGSSYSSNVCGKAKENYLSGHTSIIGAMCGTSMACPNATGIIALWLQKNPNLTVNQIRQIIKETADNDTYTSAAPAKFGSGKINALAGILDFEAETVLYKEEYDYNKDKKLSVDDITTLSNDILGTNSDNKSVTDITNLINYLQGK